jgi:TRAP-type C4-dicarboxylate transport system permease small subunit
LSTRRRLLDRLYGAGGILAAILLLLIAVLTLAQVVGRLLGILVPDAGELAGYAMAGATFLALASTFRSGGHIRVNLLLAHVPQGLRRGLEIWCLAVVALIGGMFAVFSVQQVLDSHSFGDVSTGMITIPLWIPQLSMALGAILLEIAVIEEFVSVVRGREPRYERDGAADAFTE